MLVVVTAAVLWPAVRRPPQDSFPLSTYPMFSFPLDPVADIDLVVGVDAAGSDVRLSPESIAATDEVIQAGGAVARAVAGRGDDPVALCRRVAARLVGEDPVAVEDALVSPLEALAHLPRVEVSEDERAILAEGRRIPLPAGSLEGSETPIAVHDAGGQLVAIGETRGDQIQPRKVFA